MTPQGKCAFCGDLSDLKESHIIPKFVFNWFKDSSPSAIRSIDEPNLRVQDGIKQSLLCSKCEELFSGWERSFCEKLFLPLHSSPYINTPITYNEWALKFAVSISWRVLTYFKRIDDIAHFSQEQRDMAQTALGVWHDFLIGKKANPDIYEQHLLPVEALADYSGSPISPFLNRYFLRTIHMDVICSKKSAMVYTKMGHLILFGLIQFNHRERWKGTKLHVHHGVIMRRDYRIPHNIADYWNEKADRVKEALESISIKQKRLINESMLNNVDELINSEVFRATQRDVYYSGRQALDCTKLEDTSGDSDAK